MTEQKAWELLSLVDQIYKWGVTEHRDLVISHLKEWLQYSSEIYARRAEVLKSLPGFYRGQDGRIFWQLPQWGEVSWAKHFRAARRAELQSMTQAYTVDAYIARFGPHPAGHYRFLLDFLDSCRQNGQEMEYFPWLPDGPEPQEDELNGEKEHFARDLENIYGEPFQQCLKLSAKSEPTRAPSRAKRPRDQAGKINKRRKKQKGYPILGNT